MTIGLKTKATVVIDISKMDENDRLKVTLENGDIYYLMWGGPYTVQWYIDDRQPDDPPGPVRSLGFHNWPDIGLVMKGCWWDYPKTQGIGRSIRRSSTSPPAL